MIRPQNLTARARRAVRTTLTAALTACARRHGMALLPIQELCDLTTYCARRRTVLIPAAELDRRLDLLCANATHQLDDELKALTNGAP